MKRIFILIAMLSLILAAVIALGLDYSRFALAQSPQPPDTSPQDGEIQGYPSRIMSYQGKLEINGIPCSGEIDVTFSLYTTIYGGSPIWTETRAVTCDMGLFSARLGAYTPLPYANKFQNQLWLGVKPEGSENELVPRVMLSTVPYAMNLMPGAYMVDTNPAGDYTYSMQVDTYEHHGIYANTTYMNGVGITGNAEGPSSGTSFPIGVKGFSDAGIGVSGSSENYVGVRGEGPIGVQGEAASAGDIGVYGYASSLDGAIGVFGSALGESSYAVQGVSMGKDSSGVLGISMGDSMCGYQPSLCAAGVTAQGFGNNVPGVFAYSDRDFAVYGVTHAENSQWTAYFHNTGGDDSPGLYVTGSQNVTGNLSVGGIIYGTLAPLGLNVGSEPLERGDVVVVTGVDEPILGAIPVMRVQKATPETAAAIVGVVSVLYEHYDKTDQELAQGAVPGRFNHDVTNIQPGQYLGVVTLGAYQFLKVDATKAPIHAGDLLSISDTPGVAARAQQITIDGYSFYAPGTIIGKALQDLESGTGIIAVFVSLK